MEENFAEESNLIGSVELFRSKVTVTMEIYLKIQKRKALEKCNISPTVNCHREYVCLANMGFIWRLSTPTPDDREVVRRYESEYT